MLWRHCHRMLTTGAAPPAGSGEKVSIIDTTGFDASRAARRVPWLLRRDVGDPHDLPPLLGFSGDEGSKVLGIERHRHRAELSEPRLDRRLREHGADLAIEACDDGRRRTLGRAHAGPGPCLVSR